MLTANTDKDGYRVMADGIQYTYRKGHLVSIAWERNGAVLTLTTSSMDWMPLLFLLTKSFSEFYHELCKTSNCL